MHGQAEYLLCHGVAHGQLRCVVGHGGLLVQWNGVMHHRGNASIFQLLLQGFAVFHPNGVLGVHAGVVLLYIRRRVNASLVQ